MKLFRNVKTTLVVVAAAVITAGCGGGSGGGTTNNGGGTPPSSSPVVKPNVKVLPSSGSGSLVTQTSTTVTLSGNASGISPGSVIVSGVGEGLLRRVTSVSQSGSNSIAQTTNATVADVFKQADIRLNQNLAPKSAQDLSAALAGVTLIPGTSASTSSNISTRDLEEARFTLHLNDVELTKNLRVNGEASFAIGIDILIQVREGQIDAVRFVPQINASVKGTAQFGKTQTKELVRKKIGTVSLGTTTFFVGPIPVVMVHSFDVFVVISTSGSIGYQFVTSGSRTAKVGLTYTRTGGWKGVQEVTGEPTLSVDKSGVTVDLQCSAGVAHQLSTRIYGLAGPYARLDLPRYDFKATAVLTATPRGERFQGDVVAEGTVGFEAPAVFDLKFPFSVSSSRTLFDEFIATSSLSLSGNWSGPVSLPAFGQCGASSGSIILNFTDDNGDGGGPISGSASYVGYSVGSEGSSFHGTRTENTFSVTFDNNGAKMTGTLQGGNLSIAKQAYCTNGTDTTTIQYKTTLTKSADAAATRRQLEQTTAKDACADGSGQCKEGYHIYP